jgi:hypothetical protein
MTEYLYSALKDSYFQRILQIRAAVILSLGEESALPRDLLLSF